MESKSRNGIAETKKNKTWKREWMLDSVTLDPDLHLIFTHLSVTQYAEITSCKDKWKKDYVILLSNTVIFFNISCGKNLRPQDNFCIVLSTEVILGVFGVFLLYKICMLFTRSKILMQKTVPESVSKTAQGGRPRYVFEFEGTVFCLQTEDDGE